MVYTSIHVDDQQMFLCLGGAGAAEGTGHVRFDVRRASVCEPIIAQRLAYLSTAHWRCVSSVCLLLR